MKNKPVHLRKSVYDLSEQEISNLRKAFEILYSTPISDERGASKIYQDKAGILITDGHYLRNDLLFLPWARAYFSDFEKALQNAVPDAEPVITLPYWDYTSVRAIKEGIPRLLADPFYEIKEADGSGTEQMVKQANPLYRAEYKFPLHTFRAEDPKKFFLIEAERLAKAAMEADDFVTFSTNLYLADIQSHLYVGGSSGDTNCTAYDPIFWFTHCQLDHFWYQWQQGPDGNVGIPDSVLGASLNPFTQGVRKKRVLKTKDVLDTKNLGYTYLR